MKLERVLEAALREGATSGPARYLGELLAELERWHLEEDERGQPMLPGELESAIERAALWG